MMFSFSEDDDEIVKKEFYFNDLTSNKDFLIIPDSNIVCIRCEFTCNCKKGSDFFIFKKDHLGIKTGELVKFLTEINFKPRCEHNNLKYFIKITDMQVNAIFN